jgi:hypothetical protein
MCSLSYAQQCARIWLGSIIMKKFILTAGMAVLATASAQANGCNIADVMFGSVAIELIQHKGYETAIVRGNDYPAVGTSKFDALKGAIYGQISSPERDGSRKVTNADGDICGSIGADLVIDTTDSDCNGCDKAPVTLQKVPKIDGYVVVRRGSIMGTIEGRLPK